VDARLVLFQIQHGPKTANAVLLMKLCAPRWFLLSHALLISKSKIASASTPHQDLLHLKIFATAQTIKLKL